MRAVRHLTGILLALATASRGVPLSIPLSLTETAGVPRPDAAVTCGVPVPDDAADSAWSLFDGARELPLQVTPLPVTHPRWVLLDFATPLAANERRALTLRHRPATVHARDALRVERRPDGVRVRGAALALATGAGDTLARLSDAGGTRALRVVLVSATGDTLVALADSMRVSIEAAGPVRATLGLEAPFATRDGGAGPQGLTLALRLTVRAGSRSVDADVVLRNSDAGIRREIKIRSLRLLAGAARTPPIRVARAGDRVRLPCEAAGAVLEMVPAREAVTAAYDVRTAARRSLDVDVDANGGLVVPDLSHWEAHARIDLAPAASAGTRVRDAAAFRSPLVVLAPPAWYAARGAFGIERFGTLDDERAAYAAWGLRIDPARRSWSRPPGLPPVTGVVVDWHGIDGNDDVEADEPWQNLLMLARTGQPGWLDRARAWERFVADENVPRTDGFDFAGDDYWEGENRAVHRAHEYWPERSTYTSEDSLFLANDAARGRCTPDHAWCGGLVDWFALTGEPDALAAAVDLAEMGERYFGWRVPGDSTSALGGGRFLARHWLNFMRVSEASAAPRWRALAEHLAALDSASATWDARGFYAPRAAHGGDESVITPFFAGVEARSLSRWRTLTGAPWAADRLVRMARFVAANGIDPASGWSGDYWLVGAGDSARVRHVAQDEFRGVAGPHEHEFDPLNTISVVDVLDLGWRECGDPALLACARLHWERGSRRFFRDSYARADSLTGVVGHFANSLEGWSPHAALFPDGGDLTYVASFLADAAKAGR